MMNAIIRSTVTENLKAGVYNLTPHRPTAKSSSEVWDRFEWVTTGDLSRINFIACKRCLHAYKFKKGNGTSTPMRHQCLDLKKAKRAKEQMAGPSVPSADDRSCILQSDVQVMTKDLLPCSMTRKTGFREVVQSRMHPEIKLYSHSRTRSLQDQPVEKMCQTAVMPQTVMPKTVIPQAVMPQTGMPQTVYLKSTPVEGNNPSSPIEMKLEDESPAQSDSGQRCSPAHNESRSRWDGPSIMEVGMMPKNPSSPIEIKLEDESPAQSDSGQPCPPAHSEWGSECNGPTLMEIGTMSKNDSPTAQTIDHNTLPKVSNTWTLSGNSVESTNQDQALWPVSLPDKSGSFTNLTTDPWTINIPNLSNSAGQKRKLSQETPPSPSYTSKQCKIAVREPPAPTRGKRMFSVPGERGVFQSQKWEDDQTKFSHVKHDILINTNNIEQFTFKSGTYSLTDEDGSCCGKQHGHVVIMWRISFRTDELYVSQALLFSDTQLYLRIRAQLEDI